MSASLHVKGLKKVFGGLHAVDDMSFTLDEGSFTALIGPNGAGKTTLFNLLSGTTTASAGKVFLGREEITGWPTHRRARGGIGRTFQVAATFRSMSVLDNIETALLAANRAPSLAQVLMQETGISEDASCLINELPYGNVKRVELTMALATEPCLLLLDEPTAGLARQERRKLMEVIVRLARARGVTVLFTEHDMDTVFGTADHVLVMDQGQLIAEGTPEEIRKHDDVKRVYLGDSETDHA